MPLSREKLDQKLHRNLSAFHKCVLLSDVLFSRQWENVLWQGFEVVSVTVSLSETQSQFYYLMPRRLVLGLLFCFDPLKLTLHHVSHCSGECCKWQRISACPTLLWLLGIYSQMFDRMYLELFNEKTWWEWRRTGGKVGVFGTRWRERDWAIPSSFISEAMSWLAHRHLL